MYYFEKRNLMLEFYTEKTRGSILLWIKLKVVPLELFKPKNFLNKCYMLSKFETVKIYCLSVKFDWFKQLKKGYCKSVKFHLLFQWKLTDLTVRNIFFTDESVKINWFNSGKYFFTDESVKRQITDSISENLTDSNLESGYNCQKSYNMNF